MRFSWLLVFPMVLSVVACSITGDIDPLASDSDRGTNDPASLVGHESLSEPAVGTDPVDDETVKLDPTINEIAFELILDLAGYKPDQLAGVVPDLANIIIDTAIGSPEVLDKGEVLAYDFHFGHTTTETVRTAYQCSGGGKLIHEVGEMRVRDFNNSHRRTVNIYDFDECLFDVSNDRDIDGSYSVSGVLLTREGRLHLTRLGVSYEATEWTTFDLVGPNSLRYEVDGSSAFKYEGTLDNSFSTRQSDFNYYRKTEGAEIFNEMIGSRFTMSTNWLSDKSIHILYMDFSGGFEDSRSPGQLIRVSTDIPPLISVGLAEVQLIPKGQITVQSSDGGVTTIIAKGSYEGLGPLRILADWTSTSADGLTTSDTGTLFGNFFISKTRCKFASGETPFMCKDDNFAQTLP